MEISDIIAPGHVFCDVAVSSKKRALEVLSGLLVEAGSPIEEAEIFNGLIARERLGSTGLGHGVAIPHGRFENLENAMGIFVKFEEAIDFDAIDGGAVDLVFVLMVPHESTEEHLELLASLAEMFGDSVLRDKLRDSSSPEAIVSAITSWQIDNNKVASSA